MSVLGDKKKRNSPDTSGTAAAETKPDPAGSGTVDEVVLGEEEYRARAAEPEHHEPPAPPPLREPPAPSPERRVRVKLLETKKIRLRQETLLFLAGTVVDANHYEQSMFREILSQIKSEPV